MENKLVCVAEYLSYEEGILLFNALEESQISALVKSCGPPSIPFGEGQFYQLLVPEEDLPLAKEITENFKLQVAESRRRIRCPKCKSEAVFNPYRFGRRSITPAPKFLSVKVAAKRSPAKFFTRPPSFSQFRSEI